jgi:flagellin
LSGDQILLQGEAAGAPNVAWSNLKIQSAVDSAFDIEDGINIQAGDELIDAVKLKISAKALPEDLGLSSSSITSISDALDSIEKIDAALESLYLQRSEIGASTRRLISEQTSVLNEHLQLRSTVSEIEDGDMAKASTEMANGQLHSDLNMKVMKEMFQIDRLRIVRLLEQKIGT